ncbi:hypothetical protein [Ralstonia solanacearum]|uniref:hypothetical protein n=1 Tax=Ralstonia solanacearum TaxID=305 RepID=UPI000B96441A|nr:hypothetical protein [Ralstonia solanacearum]
MDRSAGGAVSLARWMVGSRGCRHPQRDDDLAEVILPGAGPPWRTGRGALARHPREGAAAHA